jgi:hypothetical protein
VPNTHALLWSGTAASAVDLNPTDLAGITFSQALGVDGTEQVGYGSGHGTGGFSQALLWYGSGGSAVDLNPAGFVTSSATDTNGTEQVGGGSQEASGFANALVWFGTPTSAVDLQAMLPATDTWESSDAFDIDSSGDVYGTATDTNGDEFAVEWTPVPEPGSVALLGIFGVGMMMRRRGRGKC